MQRPALASSGALLLRVQAPTGHQRQAKLERLEHVSLWAEDVHQPVRVAVSVDQPREVLTTLTIVGYLLTANGNKP